jgi:hypothetical protein
MDRKSLARATDSSDAPTPGYLYLDIAKSAAISPKACQDTVHYLLKRLQNKNHNIKFKTLKIIAKVAENPATRGQFKQLVCTNPQLVGLMRDASTFRGPPDPLRGMAIYERVHEAAKETLSAIYSDSGPNGNESGGMGMAPGMGASYGTPVSTGYGANTQYGGPGGGGGAGVSTTRMEGIGNPNYSDPRSSEQTEHRGIRNMTVTEVMGTVGETVVNMVKDPLARNAQAASPARHSGGLPGYGNQPVSFVKYSELRLFFTEALLTSLTSSRLSFCQSSVWWPTGSQPTLCCDERSMDHGVQPRAWCRATTWSRI